MSETTSQTVTLALQTLVDVLGALPIPDPFKNAVLLIPTTSLKIMAISQSVKRNKKDSKDLAVYIATLTDATLRPLTGAGARPFSPAMETALKDFHETLHEVEVEMGKLASRNPLKRIVSYNEDLGTIASFKERIENARRIIETEISVATLALVEDINVVVTETHSVVAATALDVLNTRAIVSDTALIASNTQAIVSNTQAVGEDTNAVAKATRISIENRFEDDSRSKLERERYNCILTVYFLQIFDDFWNYLAPAAAVPRPLQGSKSASAL
ncbi:hypothetical protein FRB94_005951 [Tulasnella sp. JGI-2019a]|nr:hypothetical protein FRB94_005951 [Tulasnella sp. JGI-2019a]KAG9026828.1 hypothetical protein FRB95_008408 [Tulasnella sp. JGI-2019a]